MIRSNDFPARQRYDVKVNQRLPVDCRDHRGRHMSIHTTDPLLHTKVNQIKLWINHNSHQVLLYTTVLLVRWFVMTPCYVTRWQTKVTGTWVIC